MSKRHDNFDDDDERPKKKEPVWPQIRDLFCMIIEPAKSWPEANCLGTLSEMAFHFSQAHPEMNFTAEDLRLALHDMRIPYERNENNNKYYYLAKWL